MSYLAIAGVIFISMHIATRVIQVINSITFCLGQADLTRFIKYLGLTWILHWITRVNNGIW